MNEKKNVKESSFDIEFLLEMSPGQFFWKDTHSVYQGCNRNLAKILGFASPAEIKGKTDYDLPINRKYVDQFIYDDQYVINTGKNHISEYIISVVHSAKNYIIRTEKIPLYNKKNEIIGILGYAVDITSDKANEKLRRQKELAEQEADLMHFIAGAVTHELKTPIAEMDIALQTAPPSIKQYAHFDILKNGVSILNNTVSMMLAKLRYFSERNSIKEKKYFYLHSIIECVEATLKVYPFIGEERNQVHWDGFQEGFMYLGDLFLTQHILFNLIRNSLSAIKEAKKGEIFITLQTHRKLNYLIFEDTALGMAPDRLFQVFKRYSAQSESQTGTGLGLNFCKGVMKAYGGDIICESELTKYTRFVLSFPILSK